MIENNKDSSIEVRNTTPSGVLETAQPLKTNQPAQKLGRPLKRDILSKTKGHIGKRGRPPGEAAALAEFKARLINSPKSRKVLEKIFDAALDDAHKNQGAAWKLIVERLAPLSSFEKVTGGKAAITINISGLSDAKVTASEEAIEGEYTEYDHEEDEESAE